LRSQARAIGYIFWKAWRPVTGSGGFSGALAFSVLGASEQAESSIIAGSSNCKGAVFSIPYILPQLEVTHNYLAVRARWGANSISSWSAKLGCDSSSVTRWRRNIVVSCATKLDGGNGEPAGSSGKFISFPTMDW
jgi:hypothetical protein